MFSSVGGWCRWVVASVVFPRVCGFGYAKDPRERVLDRGFLVRVVRRRATLPRPVGCSTIAVPGLSFRVRNGVRASPLGHGRRKSCVVGEPVGFPVVGGLGTGWWTLVCRSAVTDRCSVSRVFRAVFAVVMPSHHRMVGCVSCFPVSTGRLHPLRGFHVRPIDHVFCMGGSKTRGSYGILILERASRLDAFSGYPFRTQPTGGATGVTTGVPEVRPPRSSRTMGRSPQYSDERRG